MCRMHAPTVLFLSQGTGAYKTAGRQSCGGECVSVGGRDRGYPGKHHIEICKKDASISYNMQYEYLGAI